MNSPDPEVQALMNRSAQLDKQYGGTPSTVNFGDLKQTGSTSTSYFNHQTPPPDYTGLALIAGLVVVVVMAIVIAFLSGKLRERTA